MPMCVLRQPYVWVKDLEMGDESLRMLARNDKTGEFVGVTAIRLKHDPAKEFHCRAEAEALRRARSSFLVKTLDSWTDGDTFFLAQEYLQGIDLESYAASLKPRDRIYRLTRLFRDIAQAVAALHEQNLILGRLTSQEVVLDATGIPRVWYSAVSLDEKSAGRMKRRVALNNTVAAVSPEELKGKEASPRSDVYAMGALMYSVYAGTALVAAVNYDEAIRNVLGQMPEAPSRYNSEIPATIDSVIMQCLERDPSKRPPTMSEVAKQLGGLVESLRPAGSTTTLTRTLLY